MIFAFLYLQIFYVLFAVEFRTSGNKGINLMQPRNISGYHSAVLLVSNKCCTLRVYQTDLWIVLRLGLRFDTKENISFLTV